MLLVVASASYSLARSSSRGMPLPAKNVQGYTALSIVQTSADTPPAVRVEVTSEEQQTRVYRIAVTSESKVVYADNIELVPGQNWSVTVRVPSPKRGEQVRVEAALDWNIQTGRQVPLGASVGRLRREAWSIRDAA